MGGVILPSTKLFSQTGIFRVNSKHASVQIGYEDYRYLTFGYGNKDEEEQIEKGQWGIEHWRGEKGWGLNFWRPSPLWNAGNYYFFISDFGRIGINMMPDINDWTHELQVNGKIKAHGFTNSSDERLKENIEPFADAILKIQKLEPVSYNYRTDVAMYDLPEIPENVSEDKRKAMENDDPTLHEAFKDDIRIGFLAQDVEKVLPEIVDTDSRGYKSIDYSDLIPVAIQAIKEQQEQIEQLQVELEHIKALNSLVNTPENLGIKATLYQNDPNPFNQRTTIKYNIESDFEEAFIDVYDFWGNSKANYSISETGTGSFVLEANTLNAGTYHYSLVVNGVIVDTRIMFIQK